MRAVPTTVQPNARPSCSAAVPTPDPTACTSMVSPACDAGLRDHRVVRGDEDLGHAAGLHEVEPSGTGAHCAAGTASSSAWAPPPAMPNTRAPSAGTVDAGAVRDDLARELEPGDVGRRAGRRGVVARELHEIGAVQAGTVHPYEDLTRPRFRIGAGLHPQPGIGGDHQGPHAATVVPAGPRPLRGYGATRGRPRPRDLRRRR